MAQRYRSLAASFNDRYQRLGDLHDLEAALENDQKALNLMAKDDPDRAEHLECLAVVFTERYYRLGDPKDFRAALQNNQAAVDLTPDGHPDRASRLLGLGISLSGQYDQLGGQKQLELAIQTFQQAVDLIPKRHPQRAKCLQNLAVSFSDRYEMYGDLEDLEGAIQADQEAVNITPEGHPDRAYALQSLARCLMVQYQKFRKSEDLEAITTHYSNSFNNVTSRPEGSWNAALEWAAFAEQFQPSNCLTAYTAAFHVLPEILWSGHTIPVRHDAVHRLGIAQASSTATKTCINLPGLSKLSFVVEIIEQGLGTIFQQMLQLKADVDGLRPDQAETLQFLSSELYSGTSANPQDIAIRRNKLLEDIRTQPGFKFFLLPKPYDVLCQASQGGPIVILNSHKDRCDAITIPNPTSEPIHIPLPNVTLEMLKSHQDKLKELLGHCSVRSRGVSASSRLFGQREGFSSKPTQECFEDLLTWLWINIVAPVYKILELHGIQNGRLWWLPTGAFTGLPLHACSPTDQFIPSYTATLGSLLEAYTKKSSSSTLQVGVVGVTQTGPHGENYLKGVEPEVKNILAAIKNANVECLEGEQATPEAVKLQLQSSTWIHLACHGTQDRLQPTKSCLLLYGGVLELETILHMPLSNAELVFLSACQTATGDVDLVNESFHLGGGFIAAGFRGAIGTLWSINDSDGPLVAELVYSHLFRDGQQPKTSDAAEALQLAVKELKARKVPYEHWIPFIHMGV
ncbi:CHAT domain-containing protein [Mycena galopus ATCC 62051]|nr:CHAT domain-containing protein [Mycena galopus ATCC 62051]